MTRCSRCHMPDTRPGALFVEGVCQACINFDKRKTIDWPRRWNELEALCQAYRGRGKYDVLIPVSGGKDSYTLVKILVEDMKMRPLLCTVTDPFTHTKAGQHNLRNLITRYNLNHWQYTISPDLFKRATRIAFEDTGEPLKYVEYAIYTIPVLLAQKFDISMVMFGENSAYEYGTSVRDDPNANGVVAAMLRKLESERPWWKRKGLTDAEIEAIMLDGGRAPDIFYMSYYFPWSSVTNKKIAEERGFKTLEGEWDRKGTVENFEQMDSVAYLFHLWMKRPKFGFQRAMDIASRRCRQGLMTLDDVKRVSETVDKDLDPWSYRDFRDTMGYTDDEMFEIVMKWAKTEDWNWPVKTK